MRFHGGSDCLREILKGGLVFWTHLVDDGDGCNILVPFRFLRHQAQRGNGGVKLGLQLDADRLHVDADSRGRTIGVDEVTDKLCGTRLSLCSGSGNSARGSLAATEAG